MLDYKSLVIAATSLFFLPERYATLLDVRLLDRRNSASDSSESCPLEIWLWHKQVRKCRD